MTDRAAFPYALGPTGQTARATPAEHLEQMLEQIVFVTPGERVNRADFGCTLRSLNFVAGPSELTTAVEALVHGALRQWVGDAIHIQDIDVAVQGSQMAVTIRYLDIRAQRVRQIRLSG